MDKNKICCQGSYVTAKFFKQLKEAGICDFGEERYWTDPGFYFGYGWSKNHITYDDKLEYFTNRNYKLVTPKEFYDTWVNDQAKKYIGFRGDGKVKLDELPPYIKRSSTLRGWSNQCVFYLDDDNQLVYIVDNEVEHHDIIKNIKILTWEQFKNEVLIKSAIKAEKEKQTEMFIGCLGSPDNDFSLLPLALKYPDFNQFSIKSPNHVFVLKGDSIYPLWADTSYVKEHVTLVSFADFIMACWQVASKCDPVIEQEFQKLATMYSTPVVIDPLKLPHFTVKSCIPESSEEKLSLSPKKSLKIVL